MIIGWVLFCLLILALVFNGLVMWFRIKRVDTTLSDDIKLLSLKIDSLQDENKRLRRMK